MRIAPVIAATAAIVVLATSAADAATRKRPAGQAIYNAPPTVFTSRDESGRTRTKILVQKRSYLDGGTEVLPGQRKYMDYAFPPYYSPVGAALGPGRNYDRQPLNAPWELGGSPRAWW